MPLHKNPCPRGKIMQSCSSGFLVELRKYVLSLFHLCLAAEQQLSGNNFVDRPVSYSATNSKNLIFIAEKKLRIFLLIFTRHVYLFGKKYKQTSSSLLLATVGLKFSSKCGRKIRAGELIDCICWRILGRQWLIKVNQKFFLYFLPIDQHVQNFFKSGIFT